jgi:hypothetical protein
MASKAFIWIPASPETIKYHAINAPMKELAAYGPETFFCYYGNEEGKLWLQEQYPWTEVVEVERNYSMLRMQAMQEHLRGRVRPNDIVIRICPDAVIIKPDLLLAWLTIVASLQPVIAGHKSSRPSSSWRIGENIKYVCGPCNATNGALFLNMDLMPPEEFVVASGRVVNVSRSRPGTYLRGNSDLWYMLQAQKAGGTPVFLDLIEASTKLEGTHPVWHPLRRYPGSAKVISNEDRYTMMKGVIDDLQKLSL